MEILEVLYVLGQACGCFLEMAALTSGTGAGIAGYKAKKRRDQRQAAEGKGEEPPAGNPYWWLFVILIFATVFFVGLLVFKYTAPLPPNAK
jgi:hypothetical protein